MGFGIGFALENSVCISRFSFESTAEGTSTPGRGALKAPRSESLQVQPGRKGCLNDEHLENNCRHPYAPGPHTILADASPGISDKHKVIARAAGKYNVAADFLLNKWFIFAPSCNCSSTPSKIIIYFNGIGMMYAAARRCPVFLFHPTLPSLGGCRGDGLIIFPFRTDARYLISLFG